MLQNDANQLLNYQRICIVEILDHITVLHSAYIQLALIPDRSQINSWKILNVEGRFALKNTEISFVQH